jgi:mannosyltransferase
MTLTIDGIIFSLQRQGGISIYFHKLLEHLKLQSTHATLLLEHPARQDVGGYGTRVSVIGRRARLLERYRSCRVSAGVSVFHSSYYRLPSIINMPSVVTVHDFVYERYAKGPKRWVHMHQKHAAIRAAQAVICVSEATRQDLIEFIGEIPGQTVHVIHNGVSEIFRPLSLAQTPAPYVLYVGERRGYKNFKLLLAAMEFLPDLELHCVGGGDLRAEELVAAPASARHRIRHLGFVTDEALNEHYNRALCLVYPSSYEGFGIPVAEAMRAGCPVVSTRCKAVLEVGGDALTVAADTDPCALADAVLRLSNVEYRNQVVSRGFEISRHFSWDRTHEGTLDVYRSLGAGLKPSY